MNEELNTAWKAVRNSGASFEAKTWIIEAIHTVILYQKIAKNLFTTKIMKDESHSNWNKYFEKT